MIDAHTTDAKNAIIAQDIIPLVFVILTAPQYVDTIYKTVSLAPAISDEIFPILLSEP